ncbi:hypothetical protein L3X38_017502 [Prunus dulcis]|uniref:RNase H type-1 domain-containing protein n=1 Tax=Prunus dulcis TaxID=3755 RepID=A0AAD4W7X9_PRUDU|nr:hypothetical protein L3X38_017502 [Prunus dulcis]
MHCLQEFQEVHPRPKTHTSRAIAKWVRPPLGAIKINVNGVFHGESSFGGVGLVVRNSTDSILASKLVVLNGISNPMHAKLVALREGLIYAAKWSNLECHIEEDSQGALHSIQRGQTDLSHLGCLTEDCRTLLASQECVYLRVTERSANGVATRLARYALHFQGVAEWVTDPSYFLQDVLFIDAMSFSCCVRYRHMWYSFLPRGFSLVVFSGKNPSSPKHYKYLTPSALAPNPPPPSLTQQYQLSQFSEISSVPKLLSMEAIACRDHSNKENLPPSSSVANLTNPVPENGSSSKKCNKKTRLRRKPLADITNLYIYGNQSSFGLSGHLPSATLPFSSSVSGSGSASNSRKRKSTQEDNTNSSKVNSSNSKSLRMGFR